MGKVAHLTSQIALVNRNLRVKYIVNINKANV